MIKIEMLLCGLAVLMLSSCNKDFENVKLEVYVYDKVTSLPLDGVKLKIENAYYEGGDFDSYNHYENFEAYTNKNGYYSIVFKKSAYVQIDVFKLGYLTEFKANEVNSYKKKIKIYLENE